MCKETFVKRMIAASGILLVAFHGHGAGADDINRVISDIIVVMGKREPAVGSVIIPDMEPAHEPDAAGLVARLAGAALVHNGSLSGQVQYRGLYGSRIAVTVNGQAFHSGGPNLMDPPMHYAPMPLIESIEVSRGASSVDSPPSLAGHVDVKLKEIPFQDDGTFVGRADMTIMGRSVDDSYSMGGVLGGASDRLRFNLIGSIEEGDDIEFPRGRVPNSNHDRKVFGLMAGFRNHNQNVKLDVRRQETGPTGNAPFAMDIESVKSEFVQLIHRIDVGSIAVDTAFGYTDIEHAMNNFDLRPAPIDASGYRRTLTDARTLTGGVKVKWNAFRFGLDHERAEKSALITNPHNGDFFIATLPGIEVKRTSVFTGWDSEAAGWNTEVGVRLDRHEADANNAVTGQDVPPGPRILAAAFDGSKKHWRDDTLDMVLRFWRDGNKGITWRGTLARKSRAPGYVERFSWLPTPASGGLADGNTYVGERELNVETATSAELGFDWYGTRAFARPTIYYRHIDDFIQGVPFDSTPDIVDSVEEMVSAMNGDPTPLRFANTKAVLYGLDVDFGLQLTSRWSVNGVLTTVRGERKDIDDDLYRVTPDELLMGLTYEAGNWRITFEGQFTAEQDRVSASNSEQETSGFSLFRIYGDWQLNARTNVSAGLENIFDREYERHLAGYNRIGDADVPLGQRLPGPGRGIVLKLHYRHW